MRHTPRLHVSLDDLLKYFEERAASLAHMRSGADGAAWRWGIDTVIPMRVLETQGKGKNRRDCMKQFKAAWERFAADEANVVEFLNAKRKRR